MSRDPSLPSPMIAGLKGCCPRCGKGRLFAGYLTLRRSCERCGLDFAFANSGDGPAFFVMSIVGIVVVALAFWVEFTYQPPMWLHLVLWSVLATVLCLLLVRPAKGLLVALQFHHKAEEGRLHR